MAPSEHCDKTAFVLDSGKSGKQENDLFRLKIKQNAINMLMFFSNGTRHILANFSSFLLGAVQLSHDQFFAPSGALTFCHTWPYLGIFQDRAKSGIIF